MTFTLSPWLVWAVLCLAVFGAWFVLSRAWWALADLWDWLARDRTAEQLEDNESGWETPCPAREDGIHCEHWYDGAACCSCGDDSAGDLPPERSWEEMTADQPIVVDRMTLMGPAERAFWSELDEFGPHGMLRPERERRAPWWEAEHRAAYESLGFDYPSGLMARVRELTP